ncbi:hypothetical protein [Agromyces indicus]|uniref:Uncharacterized protein n=1 Tax=Agromyces indicus TaxID=758919 RepID=A0ABU1FH33_9MICO|nr:hypothetical protein [Agromyces indicus]MDR5691058.1 hypothetical protein [Agromyces indicus]
MKHSRWDITPAAPLPLDELAAGSWLAVDDTEGDAGRLFVRVAEAADGRLVITGLHMSGEGEITANTLRAIQPAAILRTIAWRESGVAPPRSVGEIGPTGLARFEGVADELATVAEATEQTGDESRRGRRGPTRDKLVRLAETYRRHLRADPRDPVAATLRELARGGLPIARATAYRWLDRCRELGLLDPREDNR